MHSHGEQGASRGSDLKLVAWEITGTCNLACVHCRASATSDYDEDELSRDESLALLDQIAATGSPVVIMTGGEPLLRSDVFELAEYGTSKGLRMVMAPNGTLVTAKTAGKMLDAGIKRISISLDGHAAAAHDRFRGVAGAFDGALAGIEAAKKAGLEFQVNTTVTKANFHNLKAVMKLAEDIGAAAHHIFLLVPTGRGKYIVDQEISAEQYEETLNLYYEYGQNSAVQLKATCAPQYYRILRQRMKMEGRELSFKTRGLEAVTRGCLGGVGFAFVSRRGIVQPCGFLALDCGNVREKSFKEIWETSEVFANLRNFKNLKGKCGKCGFKRVCGGCRARAYEASGDYLAEEPLCAHVP